LLGPKHDPAGTGKAGSAGDAFARVAKAEAVFASRGDDSGTHKREMALWRSAGIDPTQASGGWYRELGAGMGATLNTAAALGAYVLSDRGTWLAFANKGPLTVLVEGDPALLNRYGVILVNPEKHPHVKAAEGRAFIDWLLSAQGQAAIDGQQLFFPHAGE